MTNADRIRTMTDDELCEFLYSFEMGDVDYAITFCSMCKKDGNTLNLDCDGCRRHWLGENADAWNGVVPIMAEVFSQSKLNLNEEEKEKMSKYEVGDKFVIEIDKIFKEDGEKLYRAKGMKSLVFDGNGLRKLIPLEDETAKIQRENEELKERLQKDIDHLCDVCTHQSALNEARAEGQQEAWELLKTMGNMYCSDFEKIFEIEEPWCVVHECTYAEAAAKLATWEKQQKEFHVGDVVQCYGEYGVVVGIGEKSLKIIKRENGLMAIWDNRKCTKTGHINMQDWLAQIGGKENE